LNSSPSAAINKEHAEINEKRTREIIGEHI
jgi:hypothetical protein